MREAWNKGKTYREKNTKVVKTNCAFCQQEIFSIESRIKTGRGKFCSKSCVGKANGIRQSVWYKTDEAKKILSNAQRTNGHYKGGYENHLMHNRRRHALKKGASGNHTLEQWQELKKRFNYMCLCCKKQEPLVKLSEDHILPLSLGGSNDISNIQPLCKSCNSQKKINIINFIPLSSIVSMKGENI